MRSVHGYYNFIHLHKVPEWIKQHNPNVCWDSEAKILIVSLPLNLSIAVTHQTKCGCVLLSEMWRRVSEEGTVPLQLINRIQRKFRTFWAGAVTEDKRCLTSSPSDLLWYLQRKMKYLFRSIIAFFNESWMACQTDMGWYEVWQSSQEAGITRVGQAM